jgi:hypothetical protein
MNYTNFNNSYDKPDSGSSTSNENINNASNAVQYFEKSNYPIEIDNLNIRN